MPPIGFEVRGAHQSSYTPLVGWDSLRCLTSRWRIHSTVNRRDIPNNTKTAGLLKFRLPYLQTNFLQLLRNLGDRLFQSGLKNLFRDSSHDLANGLSVFEDQ